MADNYTFNDAGGNVKTHRSREIAGAHASEHVPVDGRGVEVFYKGTSVLATAVSVGTTATPLPAAALTNRRSLMVCNNGGAVVYVGPSGVTTATGYPLFPRQALALETGGLIVYAIAATSGNNVRVLEIA